MTASSLQRLPLDIALQQAIAHHQAGRLQEAEQLYRAILQSQSTQPDANHNLGVLAGQLGQYAAGLPYLKAATTANPTHEQYVLSYVEALLVLGQFDEALKSLDRAMARGLNSSALQASKQRAKAMTHSPKDVTPLEVSQLLGLFEAKRHVELESRAQILVERCPNSGLAWKILSVALQTQGKDAMASLRKAAQLLPEDAEAHTNLGLALHQRGQLEDAVTSHRKALSIKPDFYRAHFNLAVCLQSQGKLHEAADSYRHALAIEPGFAEGYSNLGVVMQGLGQLNDAVATFQRSLAINPDHPDALCNLGIALRGLGQLDKAMVNYRKALVIKPDSAEAVCNLGLALNDLGQLDEAVAAYRHALDLKPDFVEGHNNLGNTLRDLGQFTKAEASFRRAIELKPNYAEAHSNLGNALYNLVRIDEAAASFRRALELMPDLISALDNLGRALVQQGHVDEAADCYRKSLALKADNVVRIKLDLMLPPIMGTKEQVEESRTRFEMNLDRLIADGVTLPEPNTDYGENNFYLAYHGLNDKDVQQEIARFHEQACPDLLYEAPHCARPRNPNGKKRIGFLSKFIFNHSVARCYSRVVQEVAQDSSLEIMLISQQDVSDDKVSRAYPNFKGTHIRLPGKFALAREKLTSLELDVLIYLDIGMDLLSYFLAFSRLARVQCVLGGHPVTTGIRNIDYFISSALAETADADHHYSEKLVRLPIGTFYFERPKLPPVFKSRAELGLPAQGQIYLCPMMLQKIHPDFDDAIARILELDTNGFVVLFKDPFGTTWHEFLKQRFEKTIPAHLLERILFLPFFDDYSDFICVNAASDVVLDPFHFGIGSTAIATFSVGTPMVTKPSEYLRGRVGLRFCNMLKIPECIAQDLEDYAQKSVSIATDKSLRERIKNKIISNSHFLFENQQPIDDMKKFLISLGEANPGLTQ